MGIEEDGDLVLVGVGIVVAYLVYKYTRQGVGVVTSAGQAVAQNVTAPALDWLYSAANPLSSDAAEARFLDAVNAELQKRGDTPLTQQEAMLARGYAPSVALFGPAVQYKDNWFFQANPNDCVQAACDELQRRRGTASTAFDPGNGGNTW